MILVDYSLVSMKQLGRKFLCGGRSTGALRLNEIVEARSYGCGPKGGVFFP